MFSYQCYYNLLFTPPCDDPGTFRVNTVGELETHTLDNVLSRCEEDRRFYHLVDMQ